MQATRSAPPTLARRVAGAGLVLAALAASAASGQEVTEDTRGNGPLVVPTRGASGILRVNSADKSARVTYVNAGTQNPFYLGFQVEAEIQNSVASIFESGDVTPGAKASFYLGRRNVTTDPKAPSASVDWMHLRLGVEGSRITLYDPDRPFGEQVSTQTFTGGTAALSYNRFFAWRDVNFLVSTSAGYRRANNYSSLSEIEVATETRTSEAGSSRTGREKTAARQGAYRESSTYPITLDAFIKPSATQLVGLSTYGRMVLSDDKPLTIAGVGLFRLKEGMPTQATAGIVAELNDVFDVSDEGGSLTDRLRVSIVVGFPLFSNRPGS
jgi:hypothetical protein